MKRTIAGIAAAGLFVTLGAATAHAADLETERALGLIISGSYESWTGVSVIGDFDTNGGATPDNDVHFMSGGEARLSFPLGETLSMQQDLKYELNSEQLFNTDSSTGVDDYFGYQFQATTHFSFLRDPSTGLLGVFGGFGGGYSDNDEMSAWFVGGEFQYYLGDWTLQGQAGYFYSDEDEGSAAETMRKAVFGRGVARWYLTPDSRIQFEASYANGVSDEDEDDAELFEWGARYDTVVAGLPLVGDTTLFARYRGNYFENTDGGVSEHFDDHTFMVGAHWSFGGSSRQEHDRFGVALDSPDIVRWAQSGEILD